MKKNLSETKKYDRAQKGMFGAKLEMMADKWMEENGKNKVDMYRELLLTSKSNAERIFSGEVSEKAMPELANKVNIQIEKLVQIDFLSVIKLIQYRFRNESYKKSFISGGITIYFAIITLLIDTLEKSTVAEWISCVGMLLATDYYIRHAKNIWGIKMVIDEKDKKIIKIFHITVFIITIATMLVVLFDLVYMVFL